MSIEKTQITSAEQQQAPSLWQRIVANLRCVLALYQTPNLG